MHSNGTHPPDEPRLFTYPNVQPRTSPRPSPFEGPALAVPCPRCGAKAGIRCSELTASSEAWTEMYGTPRRYRHAKPHPERVAKHAEVR